MQYGHALRWAWGCPMRISLILRQRREEEREREIERKWLLLGSFLIFVFSFESFGVCACSSWEVNSRLIIASLDS